MPVVGLLLLTLAGPVLLARAHSVTVDGVTTDWFNRQPVQPNTGIVARNATEQGEYIWRDANLDERTDVVAPDPRVDIQRVHATATATHLSFLVKFAGTSLTGAGAQQAQIAIDTDRIAASGEDEFAGSAETTVASAAAWERLIVTRFGSGNSTVRMYQPGFGTFADVGATARAGDGSVEISVPWADLGLGGPPTAPLRFTVASFRANADDTTAEVAGSDALDAVTDYGNPGNAGTTINEVGDGVVDKFFDLRLTAAGEVYSPALAQRFVAQGPLGSPDAEWFQFRNVTSSTLDISAFKIGDEETADEAGGGAEGMYRFPNGTNLAASGSYVIAREAADFVAAGYGTPDFELIDTGAVPDMVAFTDWAGSTSQLGDAGDEVLVLDPQNSIGDVVPYGTGVYTGVTPHAAPVINEVLRRTAASNDTDNAAIDFTTQPASCGTRPADKVWDGGAATSNWADGANWSPDGVSVVKPSRLRAGHDAERHDRPSERGHERPGARVRRGHLVRRAATR